MLFWKLPFSSSTSLRRWELMRLNKTGIRMYFSHKQKLLSQHSTPQWNKRSQWNKKSWSTVEDNIHAQIRNLAFSSFASNLHTVSQGVGARTRHLFNKTCYIFTDQVVRRWYLMVRLTSVLSALFTTPFHFLSNQGGRICSTYTEVLLLDLIAIIAPSLLIAHRFRTPIFQVLQPYTKHFHFENLFSFVKCCTLSLKTNDKVLCKK